jgi:hypothetical protein
MIVIDKWQGLVTNASPYALPAGAAVTQVNLQAIAPGQLNVRPGTVSVSFTTHTGAAAPVIQAFRYQHGTADHIVYQNSSGLVYVGKGPA